MRFDGKLKTWNEERGFGFIEPIQGGQEIFVHIKAFPRGAARPEVEQPISFEVEVGPEGKKRAKNIQLIRAGRRQQLSDGQARAPWGTATLFVLPAFFMVYLLVAVVWRPPIWIIGVYAATSLVTFVAYVVDKQAAKSGAWRTPESTLHLLALVGGWPGALVAQQLLRHKSTKAAFRQVFWLTVLINIAAFLLFCSPVGRQYWPAQ